MVDLTRFAGLQDNADSGSLMRCDKMMMNGATGDQRTDRHALRSDIAVRQDDQ